MTGAVLGPQLGPPSINTPIQLWTISLNDPIVWTVESSSPEVASVIPYAQNQSWTSFTQFLGAQCVCPLYALGAGNFNKNTVALWISDDQGDIQWVTATLLYENTLGYLSSGPNWRTSNILPIIMATTSSFAIRFTRASANASTS
ncbi:hypothetical protein AWB69_09092 [Caballeronia udeis]|uniref:Uncharacterized protein n=1 Tax=Caballeronia udeis TaxID=1232866 RepID=A0A158JZH1_9BURK|nr:hypothetical protein AWB69_09092 [Caballeronia udeis]